MQKLRYYDIKRHWTKRIEPHLGDKKLNAILVRDFHKFTYGRWKKPFTHGQYPREFETTDFGADHWGAEPRYWRYVKHSGCHWLVNFNLRLAQLAEPTRTWRIVSSDDHSTVWDGKRTLFDLNFLAFGIHPEECFALADDKHLPPGKEMKVYMAKHYTQTDTRLATFRIS